MIISMKQAINEELLFEMANLKSYRTGLPYDLWIDSIGEDRTNTHNSPRLKVNVDGNLIPIEISDVPDIPDSVKKTGTTTFKHLSLVQKYVKAYKNILLAHFYKKIDDKDALNLLGTLKNARQAELKLADLINNRPNLRIEFVWDENECLFEIEVKSDIETIATAYVFTEFELFKKLREFQMEFSVDKIIDVNNLYHQKELREKLNSI